MSWDFPENYRVTYTPNRWVKPVVRGTKLFVFLNKVEAVRFWEKDRYSWEVWECEILNPVAIKPVFPARIEEYWNYIVNNIVSKKKKFHDDAAVPRMTDIGQSCIACSAMKLTRKVKSRKYE